MPATGAWVSGGGAPSLGMGAASASMMPQGPPPPPPPSFQGTSGPR